MSINKYYLSLDISTTNVGIALWDEIGELVELKHLSLKVNKDVDPENRDLIKGNLFENYFEKYKTIIEDVYDGKIERVIVEAPLPNTKININTTALLLGFNGEARWILYKIFGVLPQKITVHESRRIFLPEFVKMNKGVETLSFPKGWGSNEKKHYIWNKVSKKHPNIEWEMKNDGTPKDYCFDMSDAYCVGESFLVKEGILKK